MNELAIDAVPVLTVAGVLVNTSAFFKSHCSFEVFVSLIILFEIQVYIGSFSIGMGAVPWVVMSEVKVDSF